jgi:hypothetical protein
LAYHTILVQAARAGRIDRSQRVRAKMLLAMFSQPRVGQPVVVLPFVRIFLVAFVINICDKRSLVRFFFADIIGWKIQVQF